MNKLVIVVSNNFSKRDEKRFGISFYKKLGVKFEVINITYLIDKRRYEFKQYDHIEEAVYLINITSYKVFYDYVDNNIDATYLLLLGTSSFSEYKIFKYLEKSKCYTGIMALGVIPTTIYLRTLCEKIKRITYRKLIKKMINILFSKFFTFPKLNFIVSHSLLYAEEHQLYDKNNTKIVLSHTLDYDIFLEHKFTNNTIKPIAVFLDGYYPYHPDNINLIGYDISNMADNYYKLINLWFEKLEKELNITVVIASHPRANPINQKYNFNGRKIYYNITEDLVSKSQLVLLHESTSINFAILHQKPIIIFAISQIMKYTGHIIKSFAKSLDKDILLVDKIETMIQVPNVDIKVYNAYIKKYIKDNNNEDFSYKILIDELHARR